MNLNYIDTFLALAKYKSFSGAADACYISQSSFSKRIKKLEDHSGVRLFNRTTTKVELTQYGKVYLEYALKVNALSEECTHKMNLLHAKDIELVIGGIPSINEYGILDVITKFISTTHIQCTVKTAPSEDLEQMLLNKQIDFAFVKNVKNTSNFVQLPFTKDHLVVVLPRGHKLSSQKFVRISQLENEDFISQPINSRPYNLCLKICQDNGFTPNVVYADRIVENILSFVQKGLGISLLMNKLIPQNSNLVVLPIEPKIVATINLCYLKNATTNIYQSKFVDFLKQENV